MKKILTAFFILAFSLIFSGCEEVDLTEGRTTTTIYYTTNDNKIADADVSHTISNTYKNGRGEIVINGVLNSINSSAFYNCVNLTSIVIPNSVTSIGDYAFYDCYGLKTVINCSNLTFSKGSSNYGYVAYYAEKIVNTPGASNIEILDDFVFSTIDGENTLIQYLGNAKEIDLPEDYNGENYRIGDEVFESNTSITSVTIGNSVTSIGNYAFYNCDGLTSIVIPNSVTSIGNGAFYWCDGLTSIVIPNSVTSIGDGAFVDCSGLTSVTIGNSVTSIGYGAFYWCDGLTSIVIPNSVTSIGERAFEGCSGLKTVINHSDLNITKGSSSNGYVGYYADTIITD